MPLPEQVSPLALLPTIFGKLGPATAVSTQRKLHYQELYRQLPDPNAFYLTVELRQHVHLSWTHQIEQVLGYQRLTLEEYFGIIHPDWQSIYLEFGIASYQLAMKNRAAIRDVNASYSVDVPLRRKNGSYAWFRQFAVNGEVDEEGKLISHVNAYRYLNEYQFYQPTGPIVTIHTTERPDLAKELHKLSYQACRNLYLHNLLDSEMTVLDAYRKAIYENPNHPVTSKHIARQTKLSEQTIKKYNSRILEKARESFPISKLTELQDFARLLTNLFGPPVSSP